MTSAASPVPLWISSEAAELCVRACDDYLAGLKEALDTVAEHERITTFGSLESARALGAKFGNLLNGDTGSLLSILEQHITVAEDLRETFRAAGRGYEEINAHTADTITTAGN